jgi:hypothetical protein
MRSLRELPVLLLLTVGLSACAAAGHANGLGGPNGNGDEDMGVVPSPDFSAGSDGSGAMPDLAGGPCDVLAQNCGANQKCTLATGDMGTCIPEGTKTLGQLCGATGDDDCVQRSQCISETMTINQCRDACLTDSDCTQPAASSPVAGANKPHCLIGLTDTTFKVCTVACQPVTAAGASGCATGLACQVFGYMSGGVTIPEATDCAGPGAGTDGSSCATNGNGDCAAGFGCVNVGGTKKCRKLCRSGTVADCTGVTSPTCRLPTGSMNWGFCCPNDNCG